MFRIEITPAKSTFSIWVVNFTWIALWLTYLVTTICRTYDDGTKYIFQLNILPRYIFLLFLLYNLLSLGWLFAFDREEFVASLVIIICLLFSIIAILKTSYVGLNKRLALMKGKKLGAEIWSVRLLLQNGYSFIGGWVFVITVLNLGIALAYGGSISLSISWSSTISLILIAVLVPLYFILDVTILSPYTLYTCSPYISLIWAFVGIVAESFDLDNAKGNSIFSVVLLIFISLFLVVKIVLIIIALCGNSKVFPMKY